MRIAIVQTRPAKGDLETNLTDHLLWVDRARIAGASWIFFPELSLTGYEPALAADLAIDPRDSFLDPLQEASNQGSISIGAGMPIRNSTGIQIGTVLFSPFAERQIYSKQFLHSDELPFFIPGSSQFLLTGKGHSLAPAICYEISVPEHAEWARRKGADLYIACVAKPASGLKNAIETLARTARTHGMDVLMTNCVGPCDDFEAAGGSSVWNQDGKRIDHLDNQSTGMIVYDPDTGSSMRVAAG